MPTRMPTRRVLCRDALAWLPTQVGAHDAVVTSIPDMSEVRLEGDAYVAFLRAAGRACLSATAADGYTVFLQTDRKHKGWLDKAYHLTDEAVRGGYRMMWHKIALRVAPGKTDLYRPTYSHMLCFSKTGAVGKPVPDVVERGTTTYANGFGIDAMRLVLEYCRANGVRAVADPFVGSGTTLATANALGMDAVGVDVDPAMCKRARALQLASF